MSRGAVPVSKAYSLSAQTAVVALEAGRHRAHGFQLCPFSRRGAWGGDKKMCSHIGFGEEEGCEGSVKNVTDRGQAEDVGAVRMPKGCVSDTNGVKRQHRQRSRRLRSVME